MIEIRKTKLSTDHSNILLSMANLTTIYSNQDQWDTTEELQVQVIEIRKTKLRPDHPDILISIANLASIY